MNLSSTKYFPLLLYVTVVEHEESKRREFIEQLERLHIKPEYHDDKIEFHYRGGRETVLKVVSYAESFRVHSISITSGAK